MYMCVRLGLCFSIYTYLCLSGFPLMAWDADLIEEAVQLANDGIDLLRQVAGVHGCWFIARGASHVGSRRVIRNNESEM